MQPLQMARQCKLERRNAIPYRSSSDVLSDVDTSRNSQAASESSSPAPLPAPKRTLMKIKSTCFRQPSVSDSEALVYLTPQELAMCRDLEKGKTPDLEHYGLVRTENGQMTMESHEFYEYRDSGKQAVAWFINLRKTEKEARRYLTPSEYGLCKSLDSTHATRSDVDRVHNINVSITISREEFGEFLRSREKAIVWFVGWRKRQLVESSAESDKTTPEDQLARQPAMNHLAAQRQSDMIMLQKAAQRQKSLNDQHADLYGAPDNFGRTLAASVFVARHTKPQTAAGLIAGLDKMYFDVDRMSRLPGSMFGCKGSEHALYVEPGSTFPSYDFGVMTSFQYKDGRMMNRHGSVAVDEVDFQEWRRVNKDPETRQTVLEVIWKRRQAARGSTDIGYRFICEGDRETAAKEEQIQQKLLTKDDWLTHEHIAYFCYLAVFVAALFVRFDW